MIPDIHVIDGNSICYVAATGMPLRSKEYNTSAAFTLLNLIINYPNRLFIFVFDGVHDKHHKNPRKIYYPDYKGNRAESKKSMNDKFGTQGALELAQTMADCLGALVVRHDCTEGDDVLWALSRKFKELKIPCFIHSGDSDLIQCVNSKYVNFIPNRPMSFAELGGSRIGKHELLSRKNFYDLTGFRFGIEYVCYKSLRGDPTDNIPGVHGIGTKKAREIISEISTKKFNYYMNLDVQAIVENRLGLDLASQFEISYNLISLREMEEKMIPLMRAKPIMPQLRLDSLSKICNRHKISSVLSFSGKLRAEISSRLHDHNIQSQEIWKKLYGA